MIYNLWRVVNILLRMNSRRCWSEVILYDVLCCIIMSELESRCTLAYKYAVVSSWCDRHTRICLCIENYAFRFIPCLQTSMIVAGYLQQKIVISYRTSVLCLCAYNDFGQQHPSRVTPTTKAMAHAVYTGHVPSHMPCACPHPTTTLKYSNML